MVGHCVYAHVAVLSPLSVLFSTAHFHPHLSPSCECRRFCRWPPPPFTTQCQPQRSRCQPLLALAALCQWLVVESFALHHPPSTLIMVCLCDHRRSCCQHQHRIEHSSSYAIPPYQAITHSMYKMRLHLVWVESIKNITIPWYSDTNVSVKNIDR